MFETLQSHPVISCAILSVALVMFIRRCFAKQADYLVAESIRQKQIARTRDSDDWALLGGYRDVRKRAKPSYRNTNKGVSYFDHVGK